MTTLINRRHISTEEFEGFDIAVTDRYNITCTRRVRGLSMMMGNYMLTDDFYIVDLANQHGIGSPMAIFS